ncbi:hypothetical protein HD806DRAFT_536757 [Xylariaceae sp. AK1471]|nr:hypothetical protein HD806DRAFT_536757 [Xylariaceae sp. AK1471]
MNPYEADPAKIPATDPYADVPFYGRYQPCPGEFVPNPPPGPSTSDVVVRYWEGIIRDQCTSANRMYEIEGWRDVFALGSVIVKSSHLSATPPHRDHALADANEPAAIALAGDRLHEMGIQAPKIYFQGKIDQRDVVVQSRIPGVALNVAWPYLTPAAKASFKEQARSIVKNLEQVPRPSTMGAGAPSYVVPDPDPLRSRGISEIENGTLFGKADSVEGEESLGFVHNDFNESNIIVEGGKIVGLIDWEMAGFFGLKRAGKVHALCRTIGRENLPNASLTEEQISDLVFWNDLYRGLERLYPGRSMSPGI